LGGPFGGGFLLMSFKYLNKDQDIFDGDDGEDVYAVLHPYEKIVHCLNWQYF
jgi:hypothetical protein